MSVRIGIIGAGNFTRSRILPNFQSLDGVEIVASHGYLPAQFLSPRCNVRDDAYGGSFENRLRFLREVIAAIREEVGRDFVVGIRISGDEMGHDGLEEGDRLFKPVYLSEDAQEGPRAFGEKRRPRWKGR